MSSSTITVSKTLIKHVATHLEERTFCVVFEDDLERCWPSETLEPAVREKEIQSFARSQGWVAVILTVDSGSEQYFGSPNRVLLITKALPWLLFESNLETEAVQTVRPLESIAETQPQLHPALLRLSAMISQYFTATADSAFLLSTQQTTK